ncbi:glycoside hydrolase family 19 protein [Taklimakanibacter albus]|uniref:Glycoside hydrolase family 19 protein n=1 Tax=Taklimakanibacter albus TaxID=2800327 RepID=A0ACC5RFV0_9HYPH|nr:glycoside hydrolase family 19 protein [Aestuariivirga sp. YIM B02566]MBK1871576.1 glycoside hydrolase family 19 protein [Aestuariivirga sp. YIM B02566]
MQIPERAILAVAPKANPVVLKDITTLEPYVWTNFGLPNRKEIIQFLAQFVHESRGLTSFEESLYYKSAERLIAVWPKRFNARNAQGYVRNPERLANNVYAGRLGNGDAASGDGWKFIGRGGLQATGREWYTYLSKRLNYDFIADPTALALSEWALPSALAVAERMKLGAIPDFVKDTEKLNGGRTGLADRQSILAKLEKNIPNG